MNTNRAEYLTHDGVMTSEISDLLIDVPDGIFIDATYGYCLLYTSDAADEEDV